MEFEFSVFHRNSLARQQIHRLCLTGQRNEDICRRFIDIDRGNNPAVISGPFIGILPVGEQQFPVISTVKRSFLTVDCRELPYIIRQFTAGFLRLPGCQRQGRSESSLVLLRIPSIPHSDP